MSDPFKSVPARHQRANIVKGAGNIGQIPFGGIDPKQIKPSLTKRLQELEDLKARDKKNQ